VPSPAIGCLSRRAVGRPIVSSSAHSPASRAAASAAIGTPQRRRVPSQEAVASARPSFKKARPPVASRWPRRTETGRPDTASQSWLLLSSGSVRQEERPLSALGSRRRRHDSCQATSGCRVRPKTPATTKHWRRFMGMPAYLLQGFRARHAAPWPLPGRATKRETPLSPAPNPVGRGHQQLRNAASTNGRSSPGLRFSRCLLAGFSLRGLGGDLLLILTCCARPRAPSLTVLPRHLDGLAAFSKSC